ncbi:MAG: serine/threonine protein kinase [Planctomyces sp.]|nr:serine/threonine protein kinase [Planctomyces sp.]
MSELSPSCNSDLLLALLRDELTSEASESLIDHLSTCTDCQLRLRELVASDAEWDRAATLISSMGKSTGDEPACLIPTFEPQSITWTEAIARQLLSPPTHPEMLGRLGRYEVERLIGSGGMGVVFKAFDTELNRPVAIKLLAPYLASSGAARQRFSREARAAAAVVHQHVVPIHNVETERESPFIVMQYVSGESLQARIDRDGPHELCEILRIGMQVADGLSAAHQQGLVHRDIKPSNILLEEVVDRALISDFGLARAADDASLTRSGFHPGTPQYMSPEQASGQLVDSRSDLFSLGSMLYTMCTGRPPFRAENSLSVMLRITESEPTPIREINASIPEWMSAVISKLMAKNAQDRPSSAAEVRDLLEACLSHVQQPLSSSLPALPWLTDSEHSQETRVSNKRWIRLKMIVLGGGILAAILALTLLPTKPARVQQTPSNDPNISAENGGLSQAVKSRLERLIKDNSLVVVGRLQEGKPTGSAYAHLFETSRILKGKTASLKVLLSHKASVNQDDPLKGQNPAVELPRLSDGEYVLVLRAEEVVNSFSSSFLGIRVTPEQTFNYFILRDGEQHAAWPLESPEAAYVTQLFVAEATAENSANSGTEEEE